MQSGTQDSDLVRIKMRRDRIRMREALKHALIQIEPGTYPCLGTDQSYTLTEEEACRRLPMVKRFLTDIMAGIRPGFDRFIAEKLDAAAAG